MRLSTILITFLISCAAAQADLSLVPLWFEENQGQAARDVGYVARCPGATLLLGQDAAVLATGSEELQIRIADAAPDAELCGRGLQTGTVSAMLGSDPSRWVRGAPTFARVVHSGVRPGVSMVYYGTADGELEFDLLLSTGASAADLVIEIEGAIEADLQVDGDLRLGLRNGDAWLRAPRVFQASVEIEAAFVLHADRGDGFARLGFRIEGHDADAPLTIDPVLSFSTYVGGSGIDLARSVDFGPTGDIYVCGYTTTTDFPTASALQSVYGGGSRDGFITRLNPATGAMVWSTYLGGSLLDEVRDLDIDAAGNVYVVGSTRSTDFPLVNPIQPVHAGSADAFYAKLDAAGTTLIYSTLHGGSDEETPHSIVVDALGGITVGGETWSLDFPTVSPIQATCAGDLDGYVARIDAAGATMLYSTYLGGEYDDTLKEIRVDPTGAVYAVGESWSVAYPVVTPLQAANAGQSDAVFSVIDATGASLTYSTYLGGSSSDGALGLDLDDNGQVVLCGWTQSVDFPTVGALQPVHGGSNDGFVTRIDTALPAPVASTFLGGSGADRFESVEIDSLGDIQLVGDSRSTDLPTVAPMQSTLQGASDVIYTRLDALASTARIVTYLGGAATERAMRIRVDAEDRAHVVAWATATGFPLVNPTQPTYGGGPYDTVALLLEPPVRTRTVSTPATTVGRGDLGVAVSVSVENVGVNALTVLVTPEFSDSLGADMAADYGVTAAPGNPTTIMPGALEVFDFTVDVSLLATPGIMTLDALVQVTDDITGEQTIDEHADTTASWEVTACVAVICGDCGGDGRTDILDALAAAQHAVGIIILDAGAFSSCNATGALEPDPAAAVDILDALIIAQNSAGLAVVLACC